MTIEAVARYSGPYVGNGSATAFAYSFVLFDAADLAVYVDAARQPASAYSVTGVGSPTGGTVVFVAAPVGTIWMFADTPRHQHLAFSEGGAIRTSALEEAFDRQVMGLWDLVEALERRPALARPVAAALRNLVWPLPGALKLLGWNADGTALTLFDSALTTVTVDPVSGRVAGKTTVTVPSVAGEVLLTAAGVIPAGALGLGVTYRCTTSFSTENSLASLSLGMDSEEDCWGAALGITAATVSNAGQWRNYRPRPAPSALDALLLANGGTFGATGACQVTGHWETFAADA